jgi:allophanate hydrolase subunit 1
MGEHAAPTLHPLGDAALVLVFGERIDPAINARVLAAWRAIHALRLPGVRDVVPAYASVTVHIDPGNPCVDALSARGVRHAPARDGRKPPRRGARVL